MSLPNAGVLTPATPEGDLIQKQGLGRCNSLRRRQPGLTVSPQLRVTAVLVRTGGEDRDSRRGMTVRGHREGTRPHARDRGPRWDRPRPQLRRGRLAFTTVGEYISVCRSVRGQIPVWGPLVEPPQEARTDRHAPAQHGDSHDGPSLLPVITGRSLKTVTCPGVQTHSPASWARPSARNSLTGLVMAFRGLSLSPWRLSAGPFAGTDGPPCSTQSCLLPTMEAGHQEGV